ncbi:hypothetical protein ACFVKB_45340 [Rhodococcus sp. NPDC127530]|jgi:hypothetical protein|uniref:hypothetical protein n=1 Tax=unclassified Rhodococcus (in: high G+C Gram-positive bacteria) TaxID=192944 RepID=UPI00363CFAA4
MPKPGFEDGATGTRPGGSASCAAATRDDDRASGRVEPESTGRVEVLPGLADRPFTVIDSLLRPVYGHATQRTSYVLRSLLILQCV